MARSSHVPDTVTLTVAKAMPVITWPKPSDITYGTALSASQLNALASVEGRFTYAPAVGDVLPAGVQTLTQPSHQPTALTLPRPMPL